MERQEDQGEYAQEGQQRVSLNEVEQVKHNSEHVAHELRIFKRSEGEYPLAKRMQAQVVLHHPNLYSLHCSIEYTFVNVCCGAQKKLYNNVTCNHANTLSQISQLQPFDAPFWRAPPNYPTDACVIQVNPQAFICTPQQVIHRQLSHAWKTFYFQSSGQLFSWSAGQLDFRCSPARAWKPEANQCGFASASSALE
ncbi:hypothetical protein O181_062085 [Austropuccinia psidii MF-1]|uniref:Uncharacterized protein n=1 Tax=Austropuccinia psidii MF-1 TaxID=1389203 RepID=A0A9Q3I122_9BASI|nr:hypothetical protein [Austropuccinia psidii MF-1]